jgi:hypothetical protein
LEQGRLGVDQFVIEEEEKEEEEEEEEEEEAAPRAPDTQLIHLAFADGAAEEQPQVLKVRVAGS